MTFLYLLPLITVIALLALRKGSLLQAGVAGLLLTLPAAYVALPDAGGFVAYLAGEAGKGAWLAWQALSVILAGLVFHNVNKSVHPEMFEPVRNPTDVFSYRRLFAVCFLLGPFFEAASGFGVGMVITLPFLLRMGVTGPSAVIFALFSQILVPWGALAVGSVVGAGLAGVTLQNMGVYSAIISVPLLFGYLAMFWRLTALEGHAVALRQRFDDVVWIGALAALLYVANRYIAVETAGLFATGVLLALRFWRDARPSADTWRAVLPPAVSYAVLTAVLLLTRTISPLRDLLQQVAVLRPGEGMLPFPFFYHVSFWLLAVALLYGVAHRTTSSQWGGIVRQVWTSARIPLAVTLVFVIMAQIMASSGMAYQLAHAWSALAGSDAVLATPVFAAVAGFLTGSNVGSNAIMMPLQSALASHAAYDLHWLSAMQNTAGSNFTMLSAIRVAMGCALLKIAGQEQEVYRRAWPLGVMALSIFVILVAIF